MNKEGYVVDLYNKRVRYSELERLENQGRLLTEALPLTFEQFVCPPGAKIIDLAFGDGSWARGVAHRYPQARVFGIDILTESIPYANDAAQLQGLSNAEFYEGNIFDPLPYPSNQFDLVASRFIMSVIPVRPDNVWPLYLAECYRITKPGGWIQLMEPDCLTIANAPAFDKLNATMEQVFYHVGKGFSRYSLGMGPIMAPLIKAAGYIDIQRQPFVIDCSFDSAYFKAFAIDCLVGFQNFKASKPLWRVINEHIDEQEFDRLIEEIEQEFRSPDFRCDWHAMRVIGRKPDKSE